jgi:menaquinone-9 beta-reductase
MGAGEPTRYDALIVGASLAGCAAATLLARHGLSVALVERSPDPAAYKTVCTHFIQPSAAPTIERLGLVPALEAAGAVRNALDLWTRWGWSHHPGHDVLPHGWSIRRERLDPIVRALAAGTAGVTLLAGWRADGLVHEHGRVAGVRVASREGRERLLRGRLVVAADGRSSTLARLAGMSARTWPNRRLTYFAYFRDLPLATGETGQLWLRDPELAYAFPNDDGLTLVTCWALQRDRAEFAQDAEAAVRARFATLPDGPDLGRGTRVSPWIGRLDMPNVYRRATHAGMALVGDAAQAADPIWGVGCGWALQTAAWLADSAGPALAGDGDLARALEGYARVRRRTLAPHHLAICDYSSGRRFRAPERLLFAAAARDRRVATSVHAYAGRLIPVQRLASPPLLARAALVLAAGRVRGRPQPAAPAPPAGEAPHTPAASRRASGAR